MDRIVLHCPNCERRYDVTPGNLIVYTNNGPSRHDGITVSVGGIIVHQCGDTPDE